MFAQCLVEVELQAANSDFHAAVVESRHRIGRYWDIVWQRDSGKIQKWDDKCSYQDGKMDIIIATIIGQKNSNKKTWMTFNNIWR